MVAVIVFLGASHCNDDDISLVSMHLSSIEVMEVMEAMEATSRKFQYPLSLQFCQSA